MKFVDSILNKFTMYKVVLYGLCFLVFVALALSLFGFIFYSPVALVSSLLILLSACFISNFILAKIFKVPANPESFVITAFILFFIMVPISQISEVWIYVLAGILAMASKYILALNKRHIFNPAAFALVVVSLLGLPQVNWWVGNSYLFPFVLIVGFLVVRKIRKIVMFLVYFIFGIISIGVFAQINDREVLRTLIEAVVSYPILFLGTIMLVEPLTTPPRRKQQMVYAGIVGLFSGAQFHIGPIFSSPELALLIGNIYSYFVSFRYRFVLTFLEKKELSPTIYEFIFSKDKNFSFLPGQYFEWTLGGIGIPDMRGIRRFFTISSAPTEENIKIGIKINENGSKFKKRLLNLEKGEKIFAGSLAGDFTLPAHKKEKYVFIAGGIGVTPFRSMIKNLIDKKEKADIILFYSSTFSQDFVYKEIFDSAKEIGVKAIYISTKPDKSWTGRTGRINKALISEEVSDYKDRIYYLSGPSSMVQSYKDLLGSLGIKRNKIHTDYFPGF